MMKMTTAMATAMTSRRLMEGVRFVSHVAVGGMRLFVCGSLDEMRRSTYMPHARKLPKLKKKH